MLDFIAGTALGGALPVLLELLGIAVLMYALLGPAPAYYPSGVRRAALFVAVLLVTPFLISTLLPLALSATGLSATQIMMAFRVGAGAFMMGALTWVILGFRKDRREASESHPPKPSAPSAENPNLS